jgi:energy-coupling factor transport system permease protein
MSQFFLYVDRDSWLHRLDPRTKVLSLLGLFTVALLFTDPRYLAVAAGPALLTLAAAGALGPLRKLSPLLLLLLLYCSLLWPFFVAGRTPLVSLAGHPFTREALAFGVGMGLRLDLMLLGGLLLLATTTIEEFTLALQRLGLPGPMGFALSLAFRWAPSLIGSAGQTVQAQRSRGLDLSAGHLLARIRHYVPLLIPMIGHSLRQTGLLAMALESKGYGPAAYQRTYLELRLRAADYLALTVVGIVVAVCLWLRWTGHGMIEVRF